MRTLWVRFLALSRASELRVVRNHPRYCSTVNEISSDVKPFNSLEKIRRQPRIYDKNRIATRVCFSALGNGAVGQPTCLCLFTEFKCYMFNCGEGAMRLIREQTEDILFIKHVFITEKSWKNMSGLPDVYLTLQQSNLKYITVHGPTGIEDFTEVLPSQQKKVTIAKRTASDSPFFDHSIEVDYVPVSSKFSYSMTHHTKTNRRSFYKRDQFDNTVMNYICKVKPKPGDLSPKKCVELGVPLGSSLLDLKNGKDVRLPSGELIRSSDVLEHGDSGCIVLVVDCPREDMIDNFIKEQKLNPAHLSEMKSTHGDVCAVFHFSPPVILQSYKYMDWMNKFPPNTLHIILNSSNASLSSEIIHSTQHVLHHIHPVIFPLIHEQPSKDISDSVRKVIQADAMLKLHVRPELKLDRENVVQLNPETYLKDSYEIPLFSTRVKELHEKLSSTNHAQKSDTGDFPEIVFLGTSSSVSTSYRNVSAILINVSSDNSILLDCGEGTYTQFCRYFGPHGVDAALRRISCIFLSHHHSDHFMGLFTLVKARKKAFSSISKPYIPVAVMTTRLIDPFIRKYDRSFEPIREDIKKFSNFLHSGEEQADSYELNQFLKGVTLRTVPVTHCRDSHGVVLNGKNWKIVYSGDAAPSQSLIDAGKDCTLLIHEASIEDEFCNEAAVKMHSTPSQVVEMAEMMNAKFAILTHFSRRYLNVPLFPESNTVGCAFDFMRVRLNDLPVLPLLIPTLKCLFSENKDTFEERTSAVVNFEKAFFRTYRR